MTSHRWPFVPFVATLVALAVACGGGADDENGGARATGAAGVSPPQSQTGAQIPDSTTLNFATLVSSLDAIESFRFDLSLELEVEAAADAAGAKLEAAAMLLDMFGNIEAEGAYDAPDSYALSLELGAISLQAVQIGDEAWTNDGSGWRATDRALPMSLDLNSLPDLALDLIPRAELAGATTSTETVNGVDATRYSFDKESLAALAADLSERAGFEKLTDLDTLALDVWLTAEGVPVKVLLDVKGESEDASISLSLDFNLTDLNDPGITIERPI